MKRIHLFLLVQNSVICFRNKSFGSEIKAHFFSIFLFSKLNDANQVKKPRLEFQTKKIRKKVRLEFGTKRFHVNHRIKEIAPVTRTLHRWISNSRWHTFLTQIKSLRLELQAHFFCRYTPLYLPRLNSFYFVSRMGLSPFVRSFWIPRLTPWFLNRHFPLVIIPF